MLERRVPDVSLSNLVSQPTAGYFAPTAPAEQSSTQQGSCTVFLTDFESLDARRQKAQLQAILKPAYGFGDEHIGLNFPG